MSNVTLTPLVEQDAVELSKNIWRKQILPKGKFNYKGETIDFDAIGKSVKTAFDAKAMDQVAFQLADAGNNHNFDPKNYRGDVQKIELTEDGVYATFDFSKFPDMQEMVSKNPKFGVSARIERDNKEHPYVFSHILGTLNPRVKGMKPWEKLELSVTDENADVTDLTDIDLANGGENVTEKKTATDATVTLTADEVVAFRKFVADQAAIDAALGGVKLSDGSDDKNEDDPAIKLANETAANALKLAQESQIELATTRWEKLEGDLTREGVPPVALSKAAELMKLPKGSSIELSKPDGEKLDAQAVVLSILESLKGTIDLSAGSGHEFNESETEDKGYDAWRDDFMRDNF
jgi:hypothetical protein